MRPVLVPLGLATAGTLPSSLQASIQPLIWFMRCITLLYLASCCPTLTCIFCRLGQGSPSTFILGCPVGVSAVGFHPSCINLAPTFWCCVSSIWCHSILVKGPLTSSPMSALTDSLPALVKGLSICPLVT